MEKKFYICKHCGNLIEMVHNAGVPVMCCGEKMQELVPNTVEASGEKHVPVVEAEGNKVVVKVGSVAHPMIPEHSIQWVYLLTDQGCQRKELKPGEAPEAAFVLEGEKAIAAYAYCNLHGLWMTEI